MPENAGFRRPRPTTRKDVSVSEGHRVLVVDGLAETEQVLKAVLEPRGVQVNRIRQHQAADSPLRDSAEDPRLLVLHEDSPTAAPTSDARWQKVPRVIIGSATVPGNSATAGGSHYLPHPFQYGELIQAIDRLLDESPA